MSFLAVAAPGTRLALMKMNFTYIGGPFVRLMATDQIDLKQLNYTYVGAFFVAYAKG